MVNKLNFVIRGIRAKLLPMKDKRLVFTSFSGHYSDSPKYIAEWVHKLDDSVEIVWLVKKRYMAEVPSYAKAVDIDAPEAWKMKASARALVDNVYGDRAVHLRHNSFAARLKFRFLGWLAHKPGQHVFTNFHGSALKRGGRDRVGNTEYDFSCPETTLMLGDRHTGDILHHISFEKIPVILTGMPRNDVLFCREEPDLALKQKLGLPPDRKILLYAPTFRDGGEGAKEKNIEDSGLRQIRDMDIDAVLQAFSQRFGGQWTLVCRFHYHVEAAVDWQSLRQRYGDRVINGNDHDDMAEYLASVDVLLTDASSSVFDFALTGRPCFLFFPDVEHYEHEERGFYLPIREMPFRLCENEAELIKTVKDFREDEYKAATEALLRQMGSAEDGHAAERCAKYILENYRNT